MSPHRRRVVPGLLLVPAVVALVGCGISAESSARAVGEDEAPFALLSPEPVVPQPPGARSEQLVFVRDAALVPVSRPALQSSPQSALSDLLAGPTPVERDDGLTTALPTTVEPGYSWWATVAEVDIGGELLDSGRSDQVLALAQVVLTLDALEEVTAVRFLQQGEPLRVPRADGVITAGLVTAADYADLVSR